jgi:hypothetical protein
MNIRSENSIPPAHNRRMRCRVRRNENIATLIAVPATSAVGIQAKVSALRLRAMIEDWDQQQQIAVSLADDLVGGIPLAVLTPAAAEQSADPIFAAIDAYRQADAALIPVDGNIPDELMERYSDAYDVVIQTRPTTPAGLAALITWVREEADQNRKDDSLLPAEMLHTAHTQNSGFMVAPVS